MASESCPAIFEPTLSFTQGFVIGQLSVVLVLAAFIKFFIFGDPPSAEATASLRATERRSRTLAHKRSLLSIRSPGARQGLSGLNRKKSSILRNPPPLTTAAILSKTYYNVDSHQPESLDWFNVLVAQTIAQFRSDAQHDDAILNSLTEALNGTTRPDFVDDIRVTELSLGDDFPIFSNCRIIPVEEDGLGLSTLRALDSLSASREGAHLQARMDVDLSDVLTLALETNLLLNYPRARSAVLPVALAVSVVRFSGTLSISFIRSNPSQSTPTRMAFNFLDDYRLDLSIRSLLGSRSRLQDVPKISQLIEGRLHRWFDERCVEPRFQEIALPSLWPRMRNTRGPDDPLAEAGSTAPPPSNCKPPAKPDHEDVVGWDSPVGRGGGPVSNAQQSNAQQSSPQQSNPQQSNPQQSSAQQSSTHQGSAQPGPPRLRHRPMREGVMMMPGAFSESTMDVRA